MKNIQRFINRLDTIQSIIHGVIDCQIQDSGCEKDGLDHRVIEVCKGKKQIFRISGCVDFWSTEFTKYGEYDHPLFKLAHTIEACAYDDLIDDEPFYTYGKRTAEH